jgi:hypothetical protein
MRSTNELEDKTGCACYPPPAHNTLNPSVAPSNTTVTMDAYILASEKISPFFDSIDRIALAIAEHVPGLGLPSPEFEVDRALALHSSTQAISYYQQYRVHLRRSFTNPEAVSNLVRDTLKQHYLITHDIAVNENLGRFRSANSTSSSRPPGRYSCIN